MQYCRVITTDVTFTFFHRAVLELRCFHSSFVASIIVESPVRRVGWSEVFLRFGFGSNVVWSTGGSMLLLETKSFPISSKLFHRAASFLKKAYYLSLLSQPAYHNGFWIIPVKSWWKFLLQRNKQHHNIFPSICYYFLLPSILQVMWYIKGGAK